MDLYYQSQCRCFRSHLLSYHRLCILRLILFYQCYYDLIITNKFVPSCIERSVWFSLSFFHNRIQYRCLVFYSHMMICHENHCLYCNTGFAKQNLVLNGDFVPTNYVGLHKILQSPQQLTTENINDVHCSLEYHIKELLQDLFIVIT